LSNAQGLCGGCGRSKARSLFLATKPPNILLLAAVYGIRYNHSNQTGSFRIIVEAQFIFGGAKGKTIISVFPFFVLRAVT
jgi:hypothetical protein